MLGNVNTFKNTWLWWSQALWESYYCCFAQLHKESNYLLTIYYDHTHRQMLLSVLIREASFCSVGTENRDLCVHDTETK